MLLLFIFTDFNLKVVFFLLEDHLTSLYIQMLEMVYACNLKIRLELV